MTPFLPRLTSLLLAACLGCTMFNSLPARAEDAAAFYKGKNVSLYIGLSVGGGYDVYGRIVARHLGRHLPGRPTVVPINMEGAGSVKLANWLYNAAPRDGLTLGTVTRGIPFEPLLGNTALARFDASKFTWIGSTTDEVGVCVAWKRTGIQTFNELRTKELIVGGTGTAADDVVHAKLISGLLGSKLRLVMGYPGGNELNFAMERGETDGRCGWSWSSVVSTRPDWVKNGDIKILLQVALRKHPELPDIPLITDLAANDEERQIMRLVLLRGVLGRPFMAPPGVPASRAAALREAFDAMVADPEFLADAAQLRLEISPISGDELQRLVAEVYATPAPLLARARAILR